MGCNEYWTMIQTRLISWRLLLITWGICRRQVGLSDKAGVSWEKRHYWYLEMALLTVCSDIEFTINCCRVKREAERQNLGEAAAGIDLGDLRSVHSNPLISVWKGWEGADDWVWVEIHLESFLCCQVRLNGVECTWQSPQRPVWQMTGASPGVCGWCVAESGPQVCCQYANWSGSMCLLTSGGAMRAIFPSRHPWNPARSTLLQ